MSVINTAHVVRYVRSLLSELLQQTSEKICTRLSLFFVVAIDKCNPNIRVFDNGALQVVYDD